MIYLDNNATTFIDPRVKEEIRSLLDVDFGNPSSSHQMGQMAKGLLSHARKRIASYLGCASGQILFTSGGTEGAYLSIRGLLKEKKGARILSSSVEHACVFETLEALKDRGDQVEYLPVGHRGSILVEDLKASVLKSRPDLIVLMAVNNETGVKNEIASIAQIADQEGIPLVVDGVALLGKEPFAIPKGVSAMFFSGHKVHAPQGVGFIYIQPKLKLEPQIRGGGQEFNTRGGTENLIGIVALGRAVELLKEELPHASEKMKKQRDLFEKALLEIPGSMVNGTGARVSNTVNLSFANVDGETLLIALDQAGVSCSLGSACSSGGIEPSRVLLNMGVSMERAQASLRFSLSRFTKDEELKEAVNVLKKLLS